MKIINSLIQEAEDDKVVRHEMSAMIKIIRKKDL